MVTANAIAKAKVAALPSARRFTSGAYEQIIEGLTIVGRRFSKLSDGYYQARSLFNLNHEWDWLSSKRSAY